MILDLDRMRYLIRSTPRAWEKIAEAEARAAHVTAQLSGMPGGSGHGDRLERDVISLIAVKEAYAESIRELEQMRKELRPLIDMLDDPGERAVMRLRYLDGYGPEEIANCEMVPMSRRTMYRALNRAERIIQKLALNGTQKSDMV